MTTPTPAGNPLAMLAQPAVDLLRNPMNPLAYLPGTWMLLAGLDHLFGNAQPASAQANVFAALRAQPQAPAADAEPVATPKPKRTRGEGAKTLEKRRKLAEPVAEVPISQAIPAPELAMAEPASAAASELVEERQDALPATRVPFQDFAVSSDTVAEEVQSNPAAPEPFESVAVVRALSFVDSIQPGARK